MKSNETNKDTCPVCGAPSGGEYYICKVCGWENDPVQTFKPDRDGGANRMSLNEAIAAYKRGEPVR